MVGCALILGATLQAASVSWQCYAPAGNAGDTLYLLAGSAVASFSTQTYTDFVSKTITSATLVDTGYDESFAKGAATDDVFVTGAGGDFYYVIVDEDKSHYWISSTQTATADNVYTLPAVGDQINSDFWAESALAWSGEFKAVPEPTSGLLLIFGMGALALRRKQK